MNYKIIIKRIIGITMVLTVLLNASCEKDLIEINTNPNALNELDYGPQLTHMQLETTGGPHEMYRTSLGYAMTAIQQMADIASPVSGIFLPGDKYLNDPLFASAFFEEAYPKEYKNFTDYLDRASKNPEDVNYYAIGRIWKVLSVHRLTDIYGNVPYSEAGKGFTENIWWPKYDLQKEIYTDLLTELEQAANSLNGDLKTPGNNDLVYGGDVVKWRKFAYSLMLRLGMRMSKVDPSSAEAWVKKAITGGVMASNDDTARIFHEDVGYRNPWEMGMEARTDVRLSKTFVDWMETKGDPRLDIISYVASGGPHKGLPNGYDQITIESYDGGSDLLTYSNFNPILRQKDSPSLHQTYAEVELLLAEAAIRGWSTGNAATHYENAIRAAMSQFEIYEDVTVPTTAEVDVYLAANPFNAADALELIGEQYWAATFLVSYEGYSNWRRTGFPVLIPVNYPGNATGGKIPRRMTYSGEEYSSNVENVNAANTAQGPDTFLTRVWWDVE